MIRRFFRWLRRRAMWISPSKMETAKKDMQERIELDRKQKEADHER
ncbi:MAG: hypothetical protein RBS40_13520 [Rhodocyclaceae bacterium]|nr:hypothetical protein [Rhodocyclaceae bacterium]